MYNEQKKHYIRYNHVHGDSTILFHVLFVICFQKLRLNLRKIEKMSQNTCPAKDQHPEH